MALIECPECSNNVSDQSLSCPNCGFPTSRINPLIECPECLSKIDAQNISCPDCGFPIRETKPSKSELLSNLPSNQKTKAQKREKNVTSRDVISVLKTIALILFIIFVFHRLVTCSSNGTAQTYNESSQENYEHYSRDNFETMQQCLGFVKEEAQRADMQVVISSDKPEKVAGSFNGDADMFFYCQKKESGTNGTFFEAAYPKFN